MESALRQAARDHNLPCIQDYHLLPIVDEVETLISRFVDDQEMDLAPFAGAAMQVAFFQRKVFNAIDHHYFSSRLRDHGISVRSIHAPAADIYHRSGGEFINTLRTIKEAYGVSVITVHPQKGNKTSAHSHLRGEHRGGGALQRPHPGDTPERRPA